MQVTINAPGGAGSLNAAGELAMATAGWNRGIVKAANARGQGLVVLRGQGLKGGDGEV